MAPCGPGSWPAILAAWLLAVAPAGWLAPQMLPAPVAPREVVQEIADALAARLAVALGEDKTVSLAALPDDERQMMARVVAGALRNRLRERGIRLYPDVANTTSVTVRCSENLRDLVCTAVVSQGTERSLVVASVPRAAVAARPAPEPLMTIALRPVLARSEPMLDLVALDDDRLVVLGRGVVTLLRHNGSGWTVAAVQVIPSARPWPRDLRGRLRREGDRVEAFLPGVSCRGTLEPFSLDCTGGRESWPLGVENDGVEPGRNHFTAEGLPPFFAAAPLERGSGAVWIVATAEGLHLFGSERLVPLGDAPTSGDEVIAIRSGCGSGSQLIVGAARPGVEPGDRLTAIEVREGSAKQVAAPVLLSGVLTALWATPGASAGIAIVRNADTGVYEAFHVGVACAR